MRSRSTFPVAVMVGLTAICHATCAAAEANLGPAALVNGVAIERPAVQELVKGLARAEPSPPDTARIEALSRAALESLIDLELLYQEAVRQGIKIPASEVDREVDSVRRHFDSDREFEAALASRGLTPASHRLDTLRTLTANRLLERTVWRDLSVSSEEVEAFYDANRAELSQPLDEIHGSIARMLLDEKKSKTRAELVDRLRKKASIARLPPYGSDLPKQKQSAEQAPTPTSPE